jgi:hypothetical protein
MGNKTSTPIYPPICKEAQRAKTKTLRDYDTDLDPIYIKKDIDLVFADCYNDIRLGKVDEEYVSAVIAAIFDWNIDDATTGEEIKEGLEQLFALASATIKGENCMECEVHHECASRIAPEIHEFIAEAIESVDKAGKGKGLKWELGPQAKFALNKLFLAYNWYNPLRHLTDGWEWDTEQLEEMWCYQTRERFQLSWEDTCWDQGVQMEMGGQHDKHCPLTRY